jgi:hypothetical protein
MYQRGSCWISMKFGIGNFCESCGENPELLKMGQKYRAFKCKPKRVSCWQQHTLM